MKRFSVLADRLRRLLRFGVALCAVPPLFGLPKAPWVDWKAFGIPRDPPVWGEWVWGFRDEAGRTAVAPQYEMARDFSEGFGAVRLGERWGFITAAARSLKPQWNAVGDFHQGLAAAAEAVRQEDGTLQVRWGYIDTRGRWALEPKYDVALAFGEGLALVGVGTRRESARPGKILLADMRLEYIDGKGRRAFPASSPESPVEADAKEGVWDEAALPAGPFQEGLAAQRLGGLWGYLNRSNAVALTARWQAAQGFRFGKAWVLSNRDWRVLEKNGRASSALPPTDRRGTLTPLPFHASNAAWVRWSSPGAPSRYGLADAEGRWTTPPTNATPWF